MFGILTWAGSQNRMLQAVCTNVLIFCIHWVWRTWEGAEVTHSGRNTVQRKRNRGGQIKGGSPLGLTVQSLSKWSTDQNFRCAGTSVWEHIVGNYHCRHALIGMLGGGHAAELIVLAWPQKTDPLYHYHEPAQSAWWQICGGLSDEEWCRATSAW